MGVRGKSTYGDANSGTGSPGRRDLSKGLEKYRNEPN